MKKKPNKYLNYIKQRRVQAACLSSFALLASMVGHAWIVPICTSIAGLLCLHSYHVPKPALKK